VLGRPDQVVAEEVQELASLTKPGAGRCACAQDLRSLQRSFGQHRVRPGADQRGPQPGIAVDDVPLPPGAPLAPDQALLFEEADRLGDGGGTDPQPLDEFGRGEAA